MLKIAHYSVQSLSHVWLFATPWIAARQASLSITSSWSLPKLMPIELVMPSSHLTLLPSIPPSIRVFSNESALHMRWSKYCSFSFSISPREMQTKTTMRYRLTLVRMAIIKKSTNNKCWRGCGEKGTILHCWWECKLIQPLWKMVWRFLKKLGIWWFDHHKTQQSHS